MCVYRINENTGTTTIQKVVIDDNTTTINNTEILKSGSVCVIFTHPALNTSSHQQSSNTSEQQTQQSAPKILVNPVGRDISSTGNVMTGYYLVFAC